MTGDVEELSVGPKGWWRGGVVEKLGGLDGAKALWETEGEHGIGFRA